MRQAAVANRRDRATPVPVTTRTIGQVLALYDDAERCAVAAGLRYASLGEPGIRRLRCGRGFSYRDPTGELVAAPVRRRIESLAIPPAWQDVWICPAADAHLLAVGNDDKGRRQYLYHAQWGLFRAQLNFHRLVDFGARLPAIRAGVAVGLRRRTMNRELVLAAMLRIIDVCGLRVGSEIYADENESYGLSTLTKRHVRIRGREVEFAFPAKSGTTARVRLTDGAVTRIVARLLQQPGRRLFTVDGAAISAQDVNDRLSELAGARVTAKDFRTWHGTRIAFASLRQHLPSNGEDTDVHILEAIDAAADFLGNTRSVARTHYVHPDVVAAFQDGCFGELLALRRPVRTAGLDPDERALLPFLRTLLSRPPTAR